MIKLSNKCRRGYYSYFNDDLFKLYKRIEVFRKDIKYSTNRIIKFRNYCVDILDELNIPLNEEDAALLEDDEHKDSESDECIDSDDSFCNDHDNPHHIAKGTLSKKARIRKFLSFGSLIEEFSSRKLETFGIVQEEVK